MPPIDKKPKGSSTLPDDFQVEALFPQGQPLEVEIGCGKGKFLLARAEASPDINFLGIDWAGKWLKRGVVRWQKRGYQNLQFIKAEARDVLAAIPSEAVTFFHVYFPDPWPKRRHHKRRLLDASFFQMLYDKLVPHGKIEIATDDREYYQRIAEAAKQCPADWKSVRESVDRRLAFEDFKTSYELKYEKDNRPLFYLELKK